MKEQIEKQAIEEMAKLMHPDLCFHASLPECRKMDGCDICHATCLYNSGYRKQSEWISVEERLPDCEQGAESKAVLFITKQGFMYTGYYGCGGIYHDRYFREFKSATEGCDISNVTHWMPLPEAPKGGEE